MKFLGFFLLLNIIYFSSFSQNNKQKVHSISANINTKANEYFPVITADGQTLYFCSDNRPENIGGEDIFVSHLVDNKWTKPQLIKELSTDTANEAVLSVSTDGNSLLIFSNGKIYESKKTKKSWSKLKYLKELNLGSWNADASYTADGNNILFSSVSKKNIGGKGYIFYSNTDIYVIHKINDTTWSKPQNLGAVINTTKKERTPFLHPDMKTLYFSSERNDGFGSIDVYKSTRKNDTSWTQWTEPQNLGAAINTKSYDYGFKISTDGQKAYFNSTTIHGDQDIYEINLSEKNKPESVVTITGIVTDNNKKPINAQIIWEDLETGKKLGELMSSPTDGRYTITLPLKKNYGFYVSKQNFYPLSDNIDLRDSLKAMKLDKNFMLTSIKKIIRKGAVIPLKNVFFQSNKYNLQSESFPELNRLAYFIKKHKNIIVEISGHTDNVGSYTYNLKLSQQRANAVRKYLILKNCKPAQIIAKGYGESKPVADNSSDKGKAKNRRVEFKVTKNN